ncbi:hypothetical protein V1506DRAFT_489897 [Lipomyces tetrasporus]
MNTISVVRKRLSTSAGLAARTIKNGERLQYVSRRGQTIINAGARGIWNEKRVCSPYGQQYFARSISLDAGKTIESSKFVPIADSTVEDNSPKIPAVTNLKQDEQGNDMLVYITPRAAARLNAIKKSERNPNLFLRVTVESGGCHGFQYLMGLKDTLDPDEDTVFDLDGAKVVMDDMSLGILKDSTVDYTTELIGSQFKIVNNPRASSSCGCGTSFDIDLGK